MTRYNKPTARPMAKSVITTEEIPTGTTYEGAPGYARETKSELFLLAVTHMADKSFYESAPERDKRFRDLVSAVTVNDAEWMKNFIAWLRSGANMRTASVVAAAEAARALLANGKPGGRGIISSALQRADEPGELLAYWHTQHGRNLPKPVKRGLADAVQRLYNEYSLMKYDTASHGYRFADVLDITHPGIKAPWQGKLYKHALDRRHGHDTTIPRGLKTIRANASLRKAAVENPAVLLDSDALREAGMTWEDALSLAGSKVPKDKLWEAMIPGMGIFALVRNLRNFDDAGVSDDVAEQVAAQLKNPETIAKSRMFPFRFLAAHRAAPSLRWSYPLEKALNLSLANVPYLRGSTLILVDRSGSMYDRISERSGLNRADTAALFGTALALRCENADLIEFGTGHAKVNFRSSESVLKVVDRFNSMGGTNTANAVRANLRSDHNRVVILTDEQAWGGYYGANPLDLIPVNVPAYTWNLAGYKYGHGPSGSKNRHTFGGLTDKSFIMIPALEAGRNDKWPWEAISA